KRHAPRKITAPFFGRKICLPLIAIKFGARANIPEAQPTDVALLGADDAAADDFSLTGQVRQGNVVLAVLFGPEAFIQPEIPKMNLAIVPGKGDSQLLDGVTGMPSYETGASGLGGLLTDFVDFFAVSHVPNTDHPGIFLAIPFARGRDE